MKYILTVIFLLCILSLHADMGSKPVKKVTIEFYNGDDTPITNIDSMLLIVNAYYGGIDTFIIHGSDFWKNRRYNLHSLKLTEKGYQLNTMWEVVSFDASFFIDNKLYKTGLINHYSGNTLYRFDVQEMRDVSPFLYTEWSRYFLSFLITIIIELLISTVILIKIKKQLVKKSSFYLSFILVNFITHFSLWYICSRFNSNLFLLEIIVIFIEFFYWKYYLKILLPKSILISFITNISSWIIGGIIGYLIWMQ